MNLVGCTIKSHTEGRWDSIIFYITPKGVKRVHWRYSGDDGFTWDFSKEEWDEEYAEEADHLCDFQPWGDEKDFDKIWSLYVND